MLGCSNAKEPFWFFSGFYLNAKCTTPVANADFAACQPIALPKSTKVMFADAVGTRKAGESSDVAFTRAVTGSEAASLFHKDDETGKCAPEQNAFKLVPSGCDGKRICRNTAHQIACTDCLTIANECPAFEGARLWAAFTP